MPNYKNALDFNMLVEELTKLGFTVTKNGYYWNLTKIACVYNESLPVTIDINKTYGGFISFGHGRHNRPFSRLPKIIERVKEIWQNEVHKEIRKQADREKLAKEYAEIQECIPVTGGVTIEKDAYSGNGNYVITFSQSPLRLRYFKDAKVFKIDRTGNIPEEKMQEIVDVLSKVTV